MISASNIAIYGGIFSDQKLTLGGMNTLKEWVASDALHNSKALYDTPKCHPHTRVAVINDIMQWVKESESARDSFMLWLFGPAGAGKSAIAKRIAELAAEEDLLIADFFFSKLSPTRNNVDRLIATLAYQLALSIPNTRSYIENAIARDPIIFNKNIPTQIDTLLIQPLLLFISSTQILPSPRLIIIDGLDECDDRQGDQVAILQAISLSFTQFNLPIKFLIASRPETQIVTSFNCNEPLKFVHRRLALDDNYRPDDDILRFFSDKFEQIRLTHPLRSTIPVSWPTQEILETLVAKSSGQFIYASTVVKFVESSCHRPSARLNIILGVSPPGKFNPFADLDVLYNHLLSSVDDIQLTLTVLSLYAVTPTFASKFWQINFMSPELFLSLEPGDIKVALINLPSIVTYNESSGAVKILHASLVDFLSDPHRSTIFHIDTASTCTDFVRRMLRYVKGPDGRRAGDIRLFHHGVIDLSSWILKGQLRSDILNFDLDAFIDASIQWQFKGHPVPILGSTIDTFQTWLKLLNDAGLEDENKEEALDILNKSFVSRLKVYQSDWRLELLLTSALIRGKSYHGLEGVPHCRCVDILLEMDHDLHLVDKNALNLRHAHGIYHDHRHTSIDIKLLEMISHHVDDGAFASAALHCTRFLSNPPKYSESNECSKTGLTYVEWKAACSMALTKLTRLLKDGAEANNSPQLLQFISNHNIDPALAQLGKHLSHERAWSVNDRGRVYPNSNMIFAIQQSLSVTYETEEWKTARNLIQQRLDECCLNIHRPALSNTFPL